MNTLDSNFIIREVNNKWDIRETMNISDGWQLLLVVEKNAILMI